ncbi:MAG TPA: PLP-dependent aminotransferase family protein [Vicinamibacterales bacterium]|nr:PLP-dependent aminotransferase family protein [Vicinamibacterales bacterium]
MSHYDSFFSQASGQMRESAIRQMGTVLAGAVDMISFAPGYPAEDQFPWHALGEIAAELLTGRDGAVLQYGPTRGYKPLRDATIDLMRVRHVTTTAEQIVMTTGSQQGLDLVARVLLDPGDVALMELPSYTGAISAFRNVGATLAGVRQEADGIDLDHLEETWGRLRADGRRVKLLYVVPNFQNPTGLLMSLAKRTALLEWAARHRVLIVEDDPYRDIYFPDVSREEDTRPLAADDRDGMVVYLSSFSKTLAPGFRVGWVSAPPAVASKIELSKQAEDLCTGGLDQRIVYEACRRGLLATHVPKLRAHYQHKRDTMIAAIERDMPDRVSWVAPRGGFFLWAALKDGLTTGQVMPLAQKRGVIFVEGHAFFVDGSGAECLRLSFSAPSPARIDEGVARLAAAIADASDRRASAEPAAVR